MLRENADAETSFCSIFSTFWQALKTFQCPPRARQGNHERHLNNNVLYPVLWGVKESVGIVRKTPLLSR